MKRLICIVFALLFVCLCGCVSDKTPPKNDSQVVLTQNDIPEFKDSPYVVLNNNQPEFSDSDLLLEPFEKYAPLDMLGRCGVAFACISKELMPTEERGGIGQVKPSGWQTVKYDVVDGKYLYNRCHLIGYQLTGENANVCNLITGTRYMNVDGMLPFENMVADYIKETGNRVLYRVTPVFDGDNLVARGVQMEALSVEDKGEGICFNVYVYNNQPQISINYADGTSALDGTATESNDTTEKAEYIINKSTEKIHKSDCSGVKSIKDENKLEFTGEVSELEKQGYTTCKTCFK